MACPAYDHTRHAVFNLRRIVSGFSFSRQCVILNGCAPRRKFESGGLGLSAGDFSQLSRSHYPSRFSFLPIVILSCFNVPRTNCVPILSLPVRLFLFNRSHFTGAHLPNLGNPLSNIG